MKKKLKFLYGLIFFAIVLAVYLVTDSKIVTIKQNNNDEQQSIAIKNNFDASELEKKYKQEVLVIIGEYEKMIDDLKGYVQATSTGMEVVLPNKNQYLNKVIDIKDKLISLKLPQKNESHMNLFISVVKMENFLSTGDLMDWRESLELFNSINNSGDLF